MQYALILLFATLALSACSDRPPTTPETQPVEFPNAGNTAIYDVDSEDPYEIGDGEFLLLRPGQYTNRHGSRLIQAVANEPDRYHIFGRRNDTLGYLLAPNGRIASIHVTSPNVVTRNGLRVGMDREEASQRQHTTDEADFRYDASARIVEIILR